MVLDISDIGPQGLSFDRSLEPAPLTERTGERPTFRETRLRGQVLPCSRGAELRAHLDATVEMTCSRCLERVPLDLSADFRLILVPQEDVSESDPEREMRDDDSLLHPVVGGKLDLVAVAREQIYLNLPLKPVCGTGCRGLCPTCGANRNRLECDCRTEQVDPRLAELARIRERMGDS